MVVGVVRVVAAFAAVLVLLLVPVSGASAATFERLSVSSGGAQGDGGSYAPSTSADGRFTAFVSNASNLVAGDTNGRCDTFVRDAQTGTTELVSLRSGGGQSEDGVQCASPAISGDGRLVAFGSDAADLVAGDANGFVDVFVRDRTAGTTRRVSVATDGSEGDSNSFDPAISADGRVVAFFSGASNFVPGRTVPDAGVYAHDLDSGATEWLSVHFDGGVQTGPSYRPSVSADGRFVAFASASDELVAGDTNISEDAFVRDRELDTTTRVSVRSDGGQIEEPRRRADDTAISADGRYVVFTSDARDLVPGVSGSVLQVFVHDQESGTTSVASVDAAGAAGRGDDSYGPSISGDGRLVAFHTGANNLYPGHVFGAIDVVVRDTVAQTTRAMTIGQGGDDFSLFPSISADGAWVAFGSTMPSLVDGDTNGAIDVFRRPVAGGDDTAPVLRLPDDVVADATSPSGAPVDYAVTATDETDPAPAVSCDPASGATFAIGDTTVDCSATDAAGNRATGTFVVHVRGADEQLDVLRARLAAAADVPRSVRQSLGSKLATVASSLAAGATDDACSELRAFVAAVERQGARLPAATAAELTAGANRIRAVTGC